MVSFRVLSAILLTEVCCNSARLAPAQTRERPATESPAALARFEAGKEAAKKGDHRQALAHFDQAMRLGLKNDQVHYWRGDSLLQLNRFTQAAGAYTRLIQIGAAGGACDT